MKRTLGTLVTVIVVLTLIALAFVFSPIKLSQTQLDALLVVGLICGGSALYCFVVGELTFNNSQMDKLWSVLPIAYTWVIAGYSGFNARSTIFAIIVTLWGIRLTYNFARKGAYSWKFWTGEEDYRWQVLRQKKILGKRPVWMMFDLFFISIYQNALVLAICLPSLAVMESTSSLNYADFLAIGLAFSFLLLETVADEQQMAFHTTKRKMLSEGKSLDELPAPYNKGFNTTGLWSRSRHPNYLGEQGIWLSLYLFVIGAGLAEKGIFHWSMVGPLVLVFLFLGSSLFQEGVSSGKYPEYSLYLAHVNKYFPLWKYNPEKYKD